MYALLKISSVQGNIAKVGEIASTSVLLNWRHENLPPRCTTKKKQRKKNELRLPAKASLQTVNWRSADSRLDWVMRARMRRRICRPIDQAAKWRRKCTVVSFRMFVYWTIYNILVAIPAHFTLAQKREKEQVCKHAKVKNLTFCRIPQTNC